MVKEQLRKELEKDFPEQLNSPKKRSSSKKSAETEVVKDLTEEETSEKPKKKIKYKYSNSMQSIADELEVPLNTANKIFKEAFTKLSKYCQSAANE